MTSVDKRRHRREPLRAPAKLWVGRWPRRRRLIGELRDLSAGGMGFESTKHFKNVEKRPAVIRCELPASITATTKSQWITTTGTWIHNGNDGPIYRYGVRLDRPLGENLHNDQVRWKKIVAAVAATALAVLIAALKTRNIISFWYDPLIQIYSIGAATYVVTRVGLSMLYREPRDCGIFKSVSMIIAVKNEEENIASTIEKCLASNYPAHLMDVLVVDDGSTDRTWDVLQGLKADYPQLRLFKFDRNRGKRHAMALGALKAKGEILVYLDSDSFLDPEGLYRIVQPMVDPSVGAVAGHTLMIVEPHNFISKMECVRYFVSQRVMKAAESLFGAVTCCPGPFSAYRREAVLAVLEPWLNQTFGGTAATFGDDRSLTNFILRRYRVLYHAGARCSTYAPGTWRNFIIQQLRWKKSWIRETTIAVRHMYREHPLAVLAYYFSVVITLVSPLIVLRAFVYSPLALQSHAYFPYVAGLLLVYLFLGLVYYYHTQSPYWYYGVAFAVLYCCFFCLQNYYAILTVRQNHWGTR